MLFPSSACSHSLKFTEWHACGLYGGDHLFSDQLHPKKSQPLRQAGAHSSVAFRTSRLTPSCFFLAVQLAGLWSSEKKEVSIWKLATPESHHCHARLSGDRSPQKSSPGLAPLSPPLPPLPRHPLPAPTPAPRSAPGEGNSVKLDGSCAIGPDRPGKRPRRLRPA